MNKRLASIKNLIPQRCSSHVLIALVAAYILVVFNGSFFGAVYDIHGIASLKDVLFMAGLSLFIGAIIYILLTLINFPWIVKPLLILLLLISPAVSYFMATYNVMIDKTMIMNVMQTDMHESLELLSVGLVGFVFLTGVLPAIWIARLQISYDPPVRFMVKKIASLLIASLVIGLVAMSFFQDYASLFRNHRYVRDLIVPINYIYSLQSYAKHFLPENVVVFKKIGGDAHKGQYWQNQSNKKVVTVLVVGETARSANFSLFNYQRETNPELSQRDIIAFSDFSSCGTSTAVSLPCMFSSLTRGDYENNLAVNSDNLLDVLHYSGLKVVWTDNNSGCKGVCNRIELTAPISPDSELCKSGECYDMILLDQLAKTIAESDKDVVVVLHQKGSHGPSYNLRTPKAYKRYLPVCETNQLQECSQQEITNAYDNTILYTDYFLSSVIDYLEANSQQIDASMVYVSDHGESLGENNLYLHGLPYAIAPKEQTHVPLILWFSQGFKERFSINESCLRAKSQQAFSHDNLFDSILGMLNVETRAYTASNDMFMGCRSLG